MPERIREDNTSPFFIRFLRFKMLLCLMIYDKYVFFPLTKLVFFINKRSKYMVKISGSLILFFMSEEFCLMIVNTECYFVLQFMHKTLSLHGVKCF